MALVGSPAQTAREHAHASGRTHGASKHVYMDKDTMYTAEHTRTDGSTIMTPSFPDATQHRHSANTGWLYGDNHISNQANGTLTFTGARHPDCSNSGGRQPYLSFSGSQEPKSMHKVIEYQAMHAQASDNAMAGRITTALNCDLPAYFTPNHSRVPKVFPFLAPVMQCDRTHETPIPIGRTVIPPLPRTEVSSSRILPLNGSCSRRSNTQLTIFYAGQINVYNDVSPTQAQDIILKATACDHLQTDKGKKLDGLSTVAAHDQSQQQNKGTLEAEKSIPSVMTNETGPLLVQAALPDFLQLDLCTGQPGQSANEPIDIDEYPPASVQEAPRTVESFAAGAQSEYHEDNHAVPKALPQARKASLARFLEKRRERMVSRAPYLVEMSFL